MAIQIIVIVRPTAGDDRNGGAQLLQRDLHRDRGAAAAQYQRLCPGGVDAAAADHVQKAKEVGVVTVQRSVRPADKGVDALQPRRRLGQGITVGHHRLFIGDGDVETVPRPGFQKGVQLRLGDLKEPVVIVCQRVMNHGGVAVTQRFPQQSAVQHHTTSL